MTTQKPDTLTPRQKLAANRKLAGADPAAVAGGRRGVPDMTHMVPRGWSFI